MSAPGRSKYVPESYDGEDLFDVPLNYEENSADIPPVRTLKPPPEIWELVHPVAPKERSPIMAFVNRVTSNGTTLMVLIFAALVLGGGSAFLIVRPDKFESKTSPKTSNVQRTTPLHSGVASTVAPAPAETDSAPAAGAVGVQPSSVVTPEALNQVPAAMTLKRVRPAKKAASVSENAIAERVSSKPSESVPAVESTEKKSVTESSAPKPKASASASPTVIAPAKPTESPRAKVIQWP